MMQKGTLYAPSFLSAPTGQQGSQEDTSQHQLVTMAQTPLAACMPPVPSLSSTFLEKLSGLVKSISLPPKPLEEKKRPETTAHVSKSAKTAADVLNSFLCPEDPQCTSIPQMALEEERTELDEVLEETEREIKALMEFWENSFVDEKEDNGLEIPWISRWHLGHPLDLNDECLQEDPSYDEERVEQEALQDSLQKLPEQRAHASVEQAASQKQDTATPDLLGKLTICAKALASMSLGSPPPRKKSRVTPSIAGESGRPSSSSEEEKATSQLRKMPKRNLQGWDSGMGKMRSSSALDRSEHLQQHKQKVSGHYRRNHQQPSTDQSSEKPEISSSGERQPSKPYNFRRQSKQVSYASQQEEEEESSPEGNSEEDWVPEEGESEAEEEEDAEEMEEEGAEKEEESEADTWSPQTKAQRPKTVRSYRCPECNREFSNSSNMRKHVRIHRGELPYGCHVCGKSYADPSNLTKHQMKHLGERPHQCPTCPKAFYVKNELDIHMRRHRGIRPFTCLECRSSFCSRAELIVHMKIHVQDKGRQPLVHCTDCDKTFAGLRLLRQHQKRHKSFVCEDCGVVFTRKFKYKFHRSLHASRVCVHCGASCTGTHLCQGPSQNAEHPELATQESSASVPQGVVAKQPVDTADSAGSTKQPIGSTQAETRSSGTEGPSVSASSQLPTDGPVRPPDVASTMSLKEPSHLAQRDGGASQRSRPLIPAPCPVLDQRTAEPSTQTPLQLKPSSVLLQDVPAVWPVTSSPAVAKPFAHTPALAGPPGLRTFLLRPQASITFPALASAPSTVVPLTDSHPKPLIVRIPLSLPQPSDSNPVGGAANNGLILLNPATLPAGTKIMLEIPCQQGVAPLIAQICAVCQAKYVGTHQCRNLPPNQAERREEQEPRIHLQGAEESTTGTWEASLVRPPCPLVQEEQGPLANSHSLDQASSEVTYISSDEEESRSDVGGDHDVRESEEDKFPAPNECLSLPVENLQELTQTKQRKDHYMCNVCDKRFVYWRSFKRHLQMHMAFFHQSEELKWQSLHHVKKTTE